MDALDAFLAADFDWVHRLDEVWLDNAGHVGGLHARDREAIVKGLHELKPGKSPLGRLLYGAGGSGKTHLLGALRREVTQQGSWFVLVDMTDVCEFWETVLQGYLNSLMQPLPGGGSQYNRLLNELLKTATKPQAGTSDSEQVWLAKVTRTLSTWPPEKVGTIAEGLGRQLFQRLGMREAQHHFDVLRALLLLNARDFSVSNLGYSWLLGLKLEDEECRTCGFKAAQRQPRDIVAGLSWVMNLFAPTLLALDQMDALVSQYDASARGAEDEGAGGVVRMLGSGLLALPDLVRRTQTVVSCLEATWEILERHTLKTITDRYLPVARLIPPPRTEVYREMIEARLSQTYERVGFVPPYPAWPFSPQAFEAEALTRIYPREVLKLCHQHQERCRNRGQVIELEAFDRDASVALTIPNEDYTDELFEQARARADLAGLFNEKDDDEALGRLLAAACRGLLRESPARDDVDAVVDVDFPGGKVYRALHARIRLIERGHGDRERHYSFRAINRSNSIAFQNRLKAAMTAAGIKASLPFRRLIIVRNEPTPAGKVSTELVETFRKAGGRIVRIDREELKTLVALKALLDEDPPGFETWLRKTRPVCRLHFVQEARLCRDPQAAEPAGDHNGGATAGRVNAAAVPPAANPSPPPISATAIPIGHRIGWADAQTVELTLASLRKHVAILAGSGSGKTVLVRRLVEEAALCGVPSIVVDPGNDLARLGDRWPEPPAAWQPGDEARAERYFAGTEVLVWTPGMDKGRPLSLAPLPDLAAVADDRDELEQAVQMACDTLLPVVAPGRSGSSRMKHGVLAAALRHFALGHFAPGGGNGLEALIGFLGELPPEAGAGIKNEQKLAREMSDHLRAALHARPLWSGSGKPLDVAELFGLHAARPRVSVVNFVGLPALEAQQGFVNELAMALFTWIKRHPAPLDRPLRGLLILDEAKDLVPSGKSTPCKESLLRLVAQARKYGLGLVFATQAPKSIDHNVIANCTTQFYGKASSPAAIEAVKQQMHERGGNGEDIARLAPGEFYVHGEGMKSPWKMQVPMCLSQHPASPLDETGVIERAVRGSE
ncbi:MAG: DUF87 domain-containing protein [Ectothiorhodospiraceae bacterium]|jgi:hypothetical protein|nr:DUF87 domain-containing protein [Ectothiorhodospiraceae bacterium]